MMTEQFKRLNRFNYVMAALHAAQALAVVALSTDFLLPVTTTYLRLNPATNGLEPTSDQLFEVSIPQLVFAFLFLSATAHLLTGSVLRPLYERDLARGMNRIRWFEYSLSASVMMVAIAMLVGIYDIATLIGIFSLVAVMNLCGLVMEVHNTPGETPRWASFWVGTVAAIPPWIMVGLAFWAGARNGSTPPTFVYWIYVSIFLFFNCFAINMWLQYRGKGRWADYLHGERVYMILSLTAKSALAWQVFAGTLRPN